MYHLFAKAQVRFNILKMGSYDDHVETGCAIIVLHEVELGHISFLALFMKEKKIAASCLHSLVKMPSTSNTNL